MDISARDGFLERFPAENRSLVANLFHYAARGDRYTGEVPTRDHDEVIRRVRHALARRRRYGYEDGQRDALLLLEEHLFTPTGELLRFVGYVVEYEDLPSEERRRLKSARRIEFVRGAMAGKPATDRQIEYLRSLGYDGEVRDRRHASDLIEERVGRGRG